MLDEEDIDIIRENKGLPRKKLKRIADSESGGSPTKTEQIDSSTFKHVKKEKDDVKKQIFEKQRGETTAADDQDYQNHNIKDKFEHEDIDDYYGTPFDQEIVEKDIPERL